MKGEEEEEGEEEERKRQRRRQQTLKWKGKKVKKFFVNWNWVGNCLLIIAAKK